MGNCSNHKKTVEKYAGSMKELAEDLGDLHYETLAEFFYDLATKLENDGLKDLNADRRDLAKELLVAADHARMTGDYIGEAWDISKPYME